MTDGTGATTYAYVPVGNTGALQLQQESGPLANSVIAYSYDALGRLASRTVAGAGAETFGYDVIGRMTSHTSDLGAFTLSYLGQTSQTTQRQLANSTLSTAWSYLPNSATAGSQASPIPGYHRDNFRPTAISHRDHEHARWRRRDDSLLHLVWNRYLSDPQRRQLSDARLLH
jgi:YD repeat-containing protein